MIARIRLVSGLVLMVFLASHLINHALGIHSLAWMEAGRGVFDWVWRSPPGTIVLCAALILHLGLVFWSLYQRSSLAMPARDWAQLLLGLTIPLLVAEHIAATRGGHELFGVNDTYPYVVYALWVDAPWKGVLQSVLIVTAWLHGCLGVHFWLRLKPWYARWQWGAFGVALLIPILALAGFVGAGIDVARLAQDPEWLPDLIASTGAGSVFNELTALMRQAQLWTIAGTVALVALILLARWLRALLAARRKAPQLTYPEGRLVDVMPGATVLETSRMAGIPHASVCGGRGRCSTCRVRLGHGRDDVEPPDANETKVLERIGNPPHVRLACQIRPTADLAVTPLLPAHAGPADAVTRPRPAGAGREQEIAVLFADLRGFTTLSEAKLPYDTVFVLNRYFEAMGHAIEGAGGQIDKFIGDGVMALFGVDSAVDDGCRQALDATTAMGQALDALNRSLAREIDQPLRLGIGLHAGPAVIGEMGYGETMNMTAIGDVVNTASRLEGATKDLSCDLVVSERVVELAGLAAMPGLPHELAVRGKRETLRVRAISNLAGAPKL
ncbi:MAG: adenylate/guanylate cyclase domain-containing protein [Pseudomonadota bacterium]